ncbi:hypothetical protein [Aliarcobacter butzleri]|uniref:hypothetical protein n=1 Tax=Aliarcobacter butzleri TaxID=28197 RepID=UPI003AFAFC3B
MYGSLGYTIADVTFGALYGQTDYDYDTTVKNLKEKELNLSVGYAFTESLEYFSIICKC